jgi:thiol-disulfide isomerase/thioredoxin
MMNRDKISALVMAMTVVISIIIIGLTIYFNSPSLTQAWSVQGEQKDKDLVVSGGVHSPEFRFEKNDDNVTKRAVQTGITHPAIASGMVENQTMTTIKLNATQFQQFDKSQFIKAPEFAQISGYINTPNDSSLTLSSLKGKVVLVYVWTYTCINSIRPMPYIHDWNQKYSDKGLVVVGVHSPEFQFEKNYTNVKDAVQRFGIKYPVVLDSDHGTWNAYQNNYWPRYYLIDSQGLIRYDHIGEGSYDQIEKSIQLLLAERAAQMGAKEISFDSKPSTVIKPESLYYVDLSQNMTPEIYVGYDTARAPLGNPEGFKPEQTVSYTIPTTTNFEPHIVYLQGKWKNNPDNVELKSDTGRIVLTYFGKSVNIIAGGKGEGIVSNDEGSAATLTTNSSLGEDLSSNGSFRIDGQRLYNLAIHNNYTSHSIVIDVKGKGFQFYTFTFG